MALASRERSGVPSSKWIHTVWIWGLSRICRLQHVPIPGCVCCAIRRRGRRAWGAHTSQLQALPPSTVVAMPISLRYCNVLRRCWSLGSQDLLCIKYDLRPTLPRTGTTGTRCVMAVQAETPARPMIGDAINDGGYPHLARCWSESVPDEISRVSERRRAANSPKNPAKSRGDFNRHSPSAYTAATSMYPYR